MVINSENNNNQSNDQQNTKEEEKNEDNNFNKIKNEFYTQNEESQTQSNDDFSKENNIITNNAQESEERSNRFQQPAFYDTSLNMNNNEDINDEDIINDDYEDDPIKQQRRMNNLIIKKTRSSQINDNSGLQIVEQQAPKKRRPVYKIPPSKKRAISQGRSLIFIHKYYDENFILEEDNEDNASDSENKKVVQTKKLGKIFREVTNIKKLFPQRVMLKRVNKDDNNNLFDQNENQNSNNIRNTDITNSDLSIEPNYPKMKLSCMSLSLDGNNITSDEKKDQNNIENIESSNNGENQVIYKSIIIDNNVVNSQIVNNPESSESQVIADSNLSGPKNSDSIVEKKDASNLSNINIETNNSEDLLNKFQIENNNSIKNNNSLIKECDTSSNINSGEINVNLNIENEKKENDEDKRISLKIDEHHLDEYFEKEGKNTREQNEVSTSLKTISSSDENRNSQILVDNLEEEEQKDILKKKSSVSSDCSNGSNLVTIDDALKGSVHIPEKIQNFVNKNNKLYDNK
jgi:hypothetical protein